LLFSPPPLESPLPARRACFSFFLEAGKLRLFLFLTPVHEAATFAVFVFFLLFSFRSADLLLDPKGLFLVCCRDDFSPPLLIRRTEWSMRSFNESCSIRRYNICDFFFSPSFPKRQSISKMIYDSGSLSESLDMGRLRFWRNRRILSHPPPFRNSPLLVINGNVTFPPLPIPAPSVYERTLSLAHLSFSSQSTRKKFSPRLPDPFSLKDVIVHVFNPPPPST